MKLKEFVEKFVCCNSLVKLWTEIPGGHQIVMENDYVCMEHELLKGTVWQSKHNDCEVIGVTDILCFDASREAINIVIKLGDK